MSSQFLSEEENEEANIQQDRITDSFEHWKPLANVAYDFLYPHVLKQAPTCCKWGDIVSENDSVLRQEIIIANNTVMMQGKLNINSNFHNYS